ncbi:MAG TPA: glycoside hydrolase family 3 N-terminal domain-containing protein [Terriglobia bacterium]|nr:glycoside hydrolase family 3 N-terminal domain-containing protein [Terriglobia bacterium]
MTANFDFGQLLMARLQDDGSNRGADQDAIRLVERFHLGGLVFTTLAKFGSPNVVAGLLARAAEASDEIPFFAFEEEGGEAHPLGEFLPGLPSPGAVGRKASDIVERLGDLIGQACKLLGFNTNFAPSLDLARSSSEMQSFGCRPRHVARCGEALVRGMKRHGVLACGKSFPGLGAARRATDSRVPVVSRTMAQLWREDLVPYRELVHQLPLIKIGVTACKAYDPQILRPATLSAGVIEGLLRAKLQYDGVAVADVSETAAAVGDAAATGETAVQSLVAGCDLLIVEGRADRVESVIREISSAIESGALAAERIGHARRRLQSAKQGLARPSAKVSSEALIKLAKQFGQFASECVAAPGEGIT